LKNPPSINHSTFSLTDKNTRQERLTHEVEPSPAKSRSPVLLQPLAPLETPLRLALRRPRRPASPPETAPF
jgi:hypothetical protein